ncbi:HNH endonuclease [Stutzerimonas nitrititolerans]|uniref:HNH endonuclease n=2 Tax=Stutzerimonas nitrititolerans TaxID=2482751 RepID=A0ABX9USW9_9GAMM|nr:HNH endonuclease [Stutzerimonas nitrititolerans]RMH96384.1 HNH endonuclease [Stutzerimonas nitrititolerans]
MPVRPPRMCAEPGCSRPSTPGSHRCRTHKAQVDARRTEQRKAAHRDYNLRRDESDGFYKTERWKKLSAYYRKRYPVCEYCNNAASDITDHVKPYKTHPELGLEWDNLRALCRPCHNRIGEQIGLAGRQDGTTRRG